jgi:hypothetical protein
MERFGLLSEGLSETTIDSSEELINMILSINEK